MAIAASGAVSFSDLRTEYVGGSSAISYSDLYRGGSNIKAKEGDNPATNLAASVPASGTIDIGDFHGTAKGFKATISSSTTNVDIDTLFGGDYDTDYPKVVDINSAVVIGGSGDDAIDIPSGLANTLTINNAGTVVGSGGTSAGQAGGNAINNAASTTVTINNTGQISGGGGAGANGSQGGNGSYSQTLGPYATPITTYTYAWYATQYGSLVVRWAGSTVANQVSYPSSQTYSTGGYTYSRGSYYTGFECGNDNTCYIYYVSRTGNTSTTGGSGGSFGLGAGFRSGAYEASATNGTSGSSGGTNAGSGSAGSNGAALGQAASNSSAGSNGNSTNGAAGQSGGAAGACVAGNSVTMNNTSTIHGSVA